MTARTWFYQTLATSSSIQALVEDRVYQGESMTRAPDIKPFMVYRFGNSSPDNAVRHARRQYVTLYLHDEGGDYMRIDAMEKAVQTLFETAPQSPNDGIIKAEWLETSADFDDQEMGTILRYMRYHLIRGVWRN